MREFHYPIYIEVLEVEEGSPAEKAGIQKHDILVRYTHEV